MVMGGGGEIRSGRRPNYDLRTLARIRSLSAKFKLPAEIKPPQVRNFQRSRKTFEIDIQAAFARPANGLQQPIVLSREMGIEEDYQRWLVQVGKVGDPGTSRAEHMVFRSFERAGWFFPESHPPGMDVEYLARVSGNAGGIEIDFFVRSRNIAILVQGEYWHFKDDETINAGLLEQAILRGQGYDVVEILAQDTNTVARTDYVVGLAMNGYETDISGRIGVFR